MFESFRSCFSLSRTKELPLVWQLFHTALYKDRGYIINKYNPTIVSDNDLVIDNIVIKKQKLDINNICSYYQNNTSINPHLVVPNYLKLPSAMESKK